MLQILTLCESCRVFFSDSFSVKPLSIATTTEKKSHCEKCGRKFGPYDLKQYMIQRREKR